MAYLTLLKAYVTKVFRGEIMKIAVLATNKCTVSAVYGVLDVFYAANYCLGQRYGKGKKEDLTCQIVTITDKPVVGYNGFKIMPTKLVHTEVPDVIVVSSSVETVIDCCPEHMTIEHVDLITTWLSHCKSKGTLITSYCTGSFVLAAAGILHQKTATTHWRSADLFRRMFPMIKLDTDQLIVDNGQVICSGGSMSYMDLSLYIIDRLVGKDIASDTAKLLVFDPVRQRQSPYVSFSAQKGHEDKAILKAQEWLESHFKQQIVIDELAERVGLTPRTFKRRFKQATFENPITYLQRIRLEFAKDKLEQTTDTVNKIMWSVGYEDLSSFRQLFKRFTGLTPKEYRQKFS